MKIQSVRQEWLKVLANAPAEALDASWVAIENPETASTLRHPETGLVMIRGRTDGAGRPFNLGEATVTRCVVARTDSGDGSEIMGVGYVLGRDKRHAECAALFDALFQDSNMDAVSRETVLTPFRDAQRAAAAHTAQETAATRVDFFTMVRGE